MIDKLLNSSIIIETVIIDQLLDCINQLIRNTNLCNTFNTYKNVNIILNGLFYMINHLINRIVKQEKKLFSQFFLLVDIANGLIEFIGKFESIFTVRIE